ncbi:homoserine kinase [Salinibacterium hongtaonis]|uniref:Homoserine kinase n=1 Tax=Homoserinimonas hongtaonis TaxID=2079791 RepID=A0A2U1SX58_9MICO|nr:homoserine kinase [Salinibacterium hongtaonis]AWB88816.1 homoserine kinase [Salinibacterium hongtaonis]PWB96217.1 homoserine kinase [Salinibacterium hongtaonis]
MTATAAPTGRSVSVRVPATSANLGPGFDTLGLALSLYDDLEVTTSERPGARVEIHGVGEGEVPTDEHNLVVRTIAFTFERYGVQLPGLDLVAHNRIPHGRGLGSSGAAIVAGIMAAKGLLDGIVDIDSNALLALASELEGHPDNVAPALFGGLTIAWTSDKGPQHKKLMVHRGVSPLICVPEKTMSTELARSLRPVTVPHEDAAFNVSRSALLIAALIQSPELLHDATEDKLHQSYRASAMPETVGLVEELRSHGLAAVVSGAGPSVLVLCSDPAQRLEAAQVVANHGGSPWQALMLAVDFKGATVNVHPAKS